MGVFKSAALAAALGLSGGLFIVPHAHALEIKLLETPSCSAGTVAMTLSCAGNFDGNTSNQNLNGLFDVADWGKEIKVDKPSASAKTTFGSGALSGVSLTIVSKGTEGTWSATGLGAFHDAMLVLKAGNFFSAYKVDLVNFAAGTSYDWDTKGVATNDKGKPKDLSHASLYVANPKGGGGDVPPAVPLPAAGWMLLSAVGAIGAARRLRQRMA